MVTDGDGGAPRRAAMNPDRAIGIILSLSVGAVLALGTWLLWRAHQAPPPPPPPSLAPTPLPSPLPAVTAAPSPAGTAAGRAGEYRLAGTVTGDLAYAIIVRPNGEHALVQPGQTVPGLGRLVAVGADTARIAGDDGEFDLRVEAAPSPTPARTSASPAATGRLTPVPEPRAPSTSGSSP